MTDNKQKYITQRNTGYEVVEGHDRLGAEGTQYMKEIKKMKNNSCRYEIKNNQEKKRIEIEKKKRKV